MMKMVMKMVMINDLLVMMIMYCLIYLFIGDDVSFPTLSITSDKNPLFLCYQDLKTPIMTTKYHSSYLTSGCWSPTRAGVFFVTRMDGVVDIWDYFYRQNEVAYSHKVCDPTLSSIAVQGTSQSGGKLVAMGDVTGTVSLLELCESLAVAQSNERKAIDLMFER